MRGFSGTTLIVCCSDKLMPPSIFTHDRIRSTFRPLFGYFHYPAIDETYSGGTHQKSFESPRDWRILHGSRAIRPIDCQLCNALCAKLVQTRELFLNAVGGFKKVKLQPCLHNTLSGLATLVDWLLYVMT